MSRAVLQIQTMEIAQTVEQELDKKYFKWFKVQILVKDDFSLIEKIIVGDEFWTGIELPC